MIYFKSPLNYTGGKYKLLPQILPNFPKKVDIFVDLFGGGFNVGININAEKILYNDHIIYLSQLFNEFNINSFDKINNEILHIISKYKLTKENKIGYISLRENYNKNKNIIELFVLSCFSFNNQIRFNNKQNFNTPFGTNKSSYNENIKKRLFDFCDILKYKNITFTHKDFLEIDTTLLTKNSLVDCDPPYLISTATYNDGKRGFKNWTISEEKELLNLLDILNNKNIKFALSNVFCHKGISNDILINWSNKYNIIYLDKDYSNCNYQLKDTFSNTKEVLITNFTL